MNYGNAGDRRYDSLRDHIEHSEHNFDHSVEKVCHRLSKKNGVGLYLLLFFKEREGVDVLAGTCGGKGRKIFNRLSNHHNRSDEESELGREKASHRNL